MRNKALEEMRVLLSCAPKMLICLLSLVIATVLGLEEGTAHPNLPLGDINVVILTDVHSWVGGHGEKEEYNVDYGDILSFYQLLQGQVAALEAADPETHKHDLFFVMNGDWIDGTGLALNGDPSYLIPVLEKMPWDVINVGNHELYERSIIEYIMRPGGFSEWWGPKFLSSNIELTDSKMPMGNEYRLLKGKHSNLLVFGFLYNMEHNDPIVTVKKVQDTINEGWFEVALVGNDFDAILVLAHMDHHDSLVQVILERIRRHVPINMPIQFVTGHTHYRGYSKPDNYSTSVEAGRYLDTVGFVSFPTHMTIQQAADAKTAAEKAAQEAAAAAAAAAASAAATLAPNCTNITANGSNATNKTLCNETITVAKTTVPVVNATAPDDAQAQYNNDFQHVFIDAKYETLADILGLEFITTEEGVDLSAFIYNVQEQLGLYKIVGCIRNDHFVNNGLFEQYSLWGLFCKHVVPHVFPWSENTEAHTGNPKVFLLDKGSWRYDLLAGDLILDEVIAVSPFNDTFYVFPGIPKSIVDQVNLTLNSGGPSAFMSKLPNWVMCDNEEYQHQNRESGVSGDEILLDLVTERFTLETIRQALENVWPNNVSSLTDIPPAVPDAELMPNHTSLSVWLEFFDQTDLCQTDNKGTHRTPNKDNKNKHDKPSDGKKNQTIGDVVGDWVGGAFQETREDKVRIDFVFIAIGVVLVFTCIYVRQRGRIWRTHVRAQQVATMEALDEYNQQHGYGYSDEPGYQDDPDSGYNSDDIPNSYLDDPDYGSANEMESTFQDEPEEGYTDEAGGKHQLELL